MPAPRSKKETPSRAGLIRFVVLATIAVAAVAVCLRQLTRHPAQAFGNVLEDIASLEQFTDPAPGGSVILWDADTVAVIERVASRDDPQSPFVLYKARWLEQAPARVRSDTTLIAHQHSPMSAQSPRVLALGRDSEARGQVIGRVVFQPGGRMLIVTRALH